MQTCASYRVYLNRTVISMSYNTEMIRFMEKKIDEQQKQITKLEQLAVSHSIEIDKLMKLAGVKCTQ